MNAIASNIKFLLAFMKKDGVKSVLMCNFIERIKILALIKSNNQ
jgi:hypothetical protein